MKNPSLPSFMTVAAVLAGVSLAGAMLAVPAAAAEQATRAAATAKATFAGGCFWCMEADFDKVPGVISTTSGYTGGTTVNPTYQEVGSGRTGHAESVEVVYDPTKVTYAQLLDAYWHNIDPLAKNRQFCDVGDEYRTAVFVHNDEQRRLAEESKKKVEVQLKQPVYTEIVAAGPFYPAEEYHQDYYLKNPARYRYYRWGCGRDQRLEQLWGKKTS